jgi:hypothetical protein
MIALEELQNYKRMKNMDLGQTEKDYLLELILFILSKETKNNLVFKGGTCLYKFYKLNRFSEDLDFSAIGELNYNSLINSLTAKLSDFGIIAEIKSKKEPFNSILATFHIQGPLYDGNSRSLASVRLDINLKSEVLIPPKFEIFHSLYRDIPFFSVLCMDKEEILAEKIRAIIVRDKPRDIYDLWFLLKQGTKFNSELVEKKMKYYKLEFNQKEFISRLSEKEEVWEEELKKFIFGELPNFKETEKEIIREITKRK